MVINNLFHDVLQSALLPLLMPFNGTGVNPRSIVILDNTLIHHVDGIVEMINEA